MHQHDTILNDLARSDRIELAARRDLFAAAPPGFGCAILRVPGTEATLMRVPALPAPSMNRVVGLPGDTALADATLDWIRHAYRAAGIDAFWLHAWDLPVDAALHAGYAARGWRPDTQAAWAKCLCDLTAPLPEVALNGALQVRAAAAGDEALCGAIVCRSFGMAPDMAPWMGAVVGRLGWQVFFALAGEVPVASAALFIDGPHAWLGMGATLPEARNQGSQQLLLAVRMAAARKAGCTVAGIESEAPPPGATRQSLNNIRRAGFREVGRRLNFRCTTG